MIDTLSIFYLYSYYFIIYSTLGWLMESTINSIRHKTFINRGFLSGFYCPIYGCGICLISFFCSSVHTVPLLVFIIGMLTATSLEYLTGVAMEKLFHTTWWDYTHIKYNFQGKICLRISIAWGILSIIFICYIQPFFTRFIYRIPTIIGELFLLLFFIVFCIDLVFSTYTAIKLSKRMPSLLQLYSELISLLEQSKLYETAEDFKNHVDSLKATHTMHTLLDKLKTGLTDVSDHQIAKLQQTTLNLQQKYHEQISKYSQGEKRLLKAFPGLSLPQLKLKVTQSVKTSIAKKNHDKTIR